MAGRTFRLEFEAITANAERGFKKLAGDSDTLTKSLDQNKRATLGAREAALKLEAAQQRAARATATYGEGSFKAVQAQTALERQSKNLQRELDNTSLKSKAASGALRGIASSVKFGAAVAGVSALSTAVSKVGSNTIDFDRAMRNVNSIAQLSEKNLASLSKQVLSLAGKTAQAPSTLAKGLYDLESSGFNAKQSMVILASSAKAATAGLTDTATSTKAVAAVLNAYHRPAKDAAQISDDLFQTVNRGVISFEELATTIGDVLPFASSLGVGLKPVGAAISTMTKEGLSGAEATTRLKNTMVAFLKPSNDMQKALKDLGYNSGESLIKAKGFQGALEALIGTTDGTKAEVAKLFPNIRALGGALALTGANTKSAETDLKAFQNTGGATDKALSQQAKSISYNWNKLKATFSAWSIEVGYALISAGRSVAQFVQANRETFNRILSALSSFVQGFVQGIRGMVKIVSGLLTLNFRRAWSGVVDIFHGGIAQAVGVLKVAAVPITVAAKAIGNALGGGISAGVRGVVSTVKGIVNDLIGFVDDAIKGINSVLRPRSLGPLGHTPGITIPTIPKIGGSSKPGNPHIPAGKAAAGAFITGPAGAGDIVPLWTKPGEVVLNEQQQSMIGKSRIFGALAATGAPSIGPGGQASSGGVVANAAKAAGFRGAGLVTAIAVADAESGFNPRAQNLKYPDHSIGLWQINQLAHRGRYGSDSQLMDPYTNARAAFAISGGGRNWSPWSTFTDGAYRAYLGVASSLAGGATGGTLAGGSLITGRKKGTPFASQTSTFHSGVKGKPPLPSYTDTTRHSDFESFYQAALTKAQITTPKDTSDDLTVLRAWRQYEQQKFDASVRSGNAQGIIDAGGQLQNIDQQISDITNPADSGVPASPGSANDLAGIRAALDEMNARAKAVVGTQDGVLTQWVTQQLMTGAGVTVGLGAQMPSSPGVLARLNP